MNFTFSDIEKNLFQKLETILTQKKDLLQGAFQTEKDIEQALLNLQQTLLPLNYLNAFNDSTTIGPVAILEMMRMFARHQPSLFLGVEYGFRIFTEIRQFLNESFMQSLQIDDTIPCAFAFCEDLVETDIKLSSMKVEADETHFFLSGQKNFVFNAGIAKWIVVNGQIDGKDTIFFISSGSENLEINPLFNQGVFPELIIANIQLRNCPVPKNRVLHSEQMNPIISTVQLFENLTSIACALGMIDLCIERTTQFAKTHQSENKPMIAHQAVAFSLAETVTLKQTAELLAYRAAWTLASNDSEKAVMSQCAKVFCSEAAERIASKCMSILGGQVFRDNHIVEQMLLNAKFIQLIGTTVHHARIAIAENTLK